MQATTHPSKSLYEIQTSAGKLLVQVNRLSRYRWVLVTYSGLLRMEGSMHLAHSTPYQKEPTVLCLEGGEGAAERIARELCLRIEMPVLLSLSVELVINKQGETDLLEALTKVIAV